MRYEDLAAQLRALPGEVRFVAVDGCGGAGKSTFASHLSDACGGCPVVHTDDFASWEEPFEWWPRMLHEVIEPLAAGRTADFQRYDWKSRKLVAEIHVAPEPIVIIEGVSSSRSEWAQQLAFTNWVTAPREVRLQRGLERDGVGAVSLWTDWMAGEDDYVARDRPIERADLVVDGAFAIRVADANTFAVVRDAWEVAGPDRDE
jgi:uridine kinase